MRLSKPVKMKSIKVKINEKEIIVKKLPLGRYAELLGAIDELPKELAQDVLNLDKASPTKIIASVPMLLKLAAPQFIKILSVASGVEVLYLTEECGALEAGKLLVGIIEVNGYLELKNVLAVAFKKTAAKKDPKIGSGK